MLDGKQLDVAQVKKLATLPTREQMLSELAAGLQSPIAALVGTMNGMLTMMVGALEALRTQREGTN
jgi:large subunit ribosomal protein L10